MEREAVLQGAALTSPTHVGCYMFPLRNLRSRYSCAFVNVLLTKAQEHLCPAEVHYTCKCAFHSQQETDVTIVEITVVIKTFIACGVYVLI